MSDEIVKVEPAGALANYEEQMAAEARDEAAKERVFASKMSKDGGIIRIGGQEIGKTVQAVILGSAFIKALYESAYDPDDVTPPSCWAIAENEQDLAPDPELTWKVVNNSCAGCPANEFKSGRGKAKACGDKRRLIVMAATDLVNADAVAKADVYTVEVSATGLKGWAYYVKALRDNFNRPPYGVITELSPMAMKTWYIWTFKPTSLVPNEILGAVMAKKAAIKDQLMAGWTKPSEDPALKAQAQAPKKF